MAHGSSQQPQQTPTRPLLHTVFFTLCLIFAIVAAAMAVLSLVFSLAGGSLEVITLSLAAMAIACSGTCWLFSRLARR